jgi:hypothetical protein
MPRVTEVLVLLPKEFSDAEWLVSGSVLISGLRVGFRCGWDAAAQLGRCIFGLWARAAE